MAQWSATGSNLADSYTQKRKSLVTTSFNWYKWQGLNWQQWHSNVFYSPILNFRTLAFQPQTKAKHGKDSSFSFISHTFHCIGSVSRPTVSRRLTTNLLIMANCDSGYFPQFEVGSTLPISSNSFISWNPSVTVDTGIQLLSDLVKWGSVVTYS